MNQQDLTILLIIINTIVGGANLAFILKIMLNDIHELRQMLVHHLEMHARSEKKSASF